jgi:hypothetical protein
MPGGTVSTVDVFLARALLRSLIMNHHRRPSSKALVVLHWTVRAIHGYQPFAQFGPAEFAWKGLIAAFPDYLPAVLMPNHAHLLLRVSEHDWSVRRDAIEKNMRERLTGWMSGVKRRSGGVFQWEPIVMPTVIRDPQTLMRNFRYIALNSCRKRLCRDPLEWVFSSYREVLGCTVQNTHVVDRMLEALGESDTREHSISAFPARFHRYVTGDPSVQIEGTKPPVAPSMIRTGGTDAVEFPLSWVIKAAAASLRTLPQEVANNRNLRHIAVHLSALAGWKRPTEIARAVQLGRSQVGRILAQKRPSGIEAAWLCLHDPRLRVYLDGTL